MDYIIYLIPRRGDFHLWHKFGFVSSSLTADIYGIFKWRPSREGAIARGKFNPIQETN